MLVLEVLDEQVGQRTRPNAKPSSMRSMECTPMTERMCDKFSFSDDRAGITLDPHRPLIPPFRRSGLPNHASKRQKGYNLILKNRPPFSCPQLLAQLPPIIWSSTATSAGRQFITYLHFSSSPMCTPRRHVFRFIRFSHKGFGLR